MDFLLYRAPPLLLFIFIFWVPVTYSLSTVSISKTPTQTLVCALVQDGNSQQSSLTCSSFPVGIRVPVNPNISFSGIVSGDGFVCALTSFHSHSISSMVCWRFSTNGTGMYHKRIYEGPAIRELKAGNCHICGLVNENNRLRCWQWNDLETSTAPAYSSIAVGDEFVCGLAGGGVVKCLGNATNIDAQSPSGNYASIAAGSRHACALTFDNEMECWGEMVGEKPAGKFMSMALGENRSCALRANETVVCWGENDFSLPQSLEETYFVSIEAKRDIFCGVVKRNFSLYCWGNEDLESRLRVFDSVMPGSCSSSCPCGPLSQSGIFCPEGYSICELCWHDMSVKPVNETSTQSLPPLSQPRSQWKREMIALLVVGCVGTLTLSLVTTFFVFKYYKCRRCRVHDSGRLNETGLPVQQGLNRLRKPQPEQAPAVLEKRLSWLASIGNAGQLTEFSLQLLQKATNNFSEDRSIGIGSFGSVYLGLLGDCRQVAIKRAEVSRTYSCARGNKRQEDKDSAFVHELQSLSRLNHKNLIRLLGFYEDSKERILVYEYMHNGTLHDYLHDLQNPPLLSWPARIKLALDAARGVEYLHEYAVPPIIHRDIKSSNILIDSQWTAKVSDFGLSLMSPPDDESALSLMPAGTLGYMDPEYCRLQQLTTKSDVYSFGVVLLELISGYKAIHRNENEVPRNVVEFAVPYIVKDEIDRVLDPRAPPPTPLEIEAVGYIGYLAADCVTFDGRERPSMTEVVHRLERALAACLVRPMSLSRSITGSGSST
ncbi:hypothetical protein K2173_008936 [Erythroxylum novogranatense]|uniref:Protein kinase domain-containing protein n=1 Tax=Erythroxylum novogranatense TaxID=1862640 RepID=A0AAV8TUT9_9ROSI|nr:hypothetical protein K2173_008936 [Erythroxylum novogranatense]